MPEPVARGQRYMPGLDGLRAIAVVAVVVYHLGLGWAGGGLLGVGVFFTLSGYLITDLLLARLPERGVLLGAFWLARARRLLPALLLMLAVVTVWVVAVGPTPSNFTGSLAAGVLYVSNWQLILHDVSYFEQFGPPSPLNHLWSLAVEEQFYIVWPLLLLVLVHLVRERPRAGGIRPRLAALTLLIATVSAVEMAVLYSPGVDPSRIYFGADTRAFELLAGAALAMVWPSRRLMRGTAPSAVRLLDGLGALGLAVILLLIWRTNEYSPFLYTGGFVVLSVATVLVIAAVAHPSTVLGRVLGVAPLRWIGARSYGIYLWHFPVIAFTTATVGQAFDLRRALLQVAATVCLAALSWRFVEDPIRHGALGRMWHRVRSRDLPPPRLPRPATVAWVGALTAVVVAAVAMTESPVSAQRPEAIGKAATSLSVSTPPAAPWVARKLAVASGTTAVTRALTSCSAVTYVGDSTSVGLQSPSYIPSAGRRINAQLARVGARIRKIEISGARSIVETYRTEPNAYDVARGVRNSGFRGCWVFALGTNDTANVYVGSGVSRLTRIRKMMSVAGGSPVLWVNVKSLLGTGPYAAQNMRLWNEALVDACRAYPNLRVYDWAAVVRNEWFAGDGIHFNTPGYTARSRLIARALVDGFPAGGPNSSCLVG